MISGHGNIKGDMTGKLVEWESLWNVKNCVFWHERKLCVFTVNMELIMKWNNIELWHVMKMVL